MSARTISEIESLSKTAKKYLSMYCRGEKLEITSHRKGRFGEPFRYFINGEEVRLSEYLEVLSTPWMPESGPSVATQIEEGIFSYSCTFSKHPSRPLIKEIPSYKLCVDQQDA